MFTFVSRYQLFVYIFCRPVGSYNQQHWLIQEAEQRRIAEQQMRQQYTQQQQQQQSPPQQQQQPQNEHQQQQQQSPVYENSNYVGGMQVPPPNQVKTVYLVWGLFLRVILRPCSDWLLPLLQGT